MGMKIIPLVDPLRTCSFSRMKCGVLRFCYFSGSAASFGGGRVEGPALDPETRATISGS